jgi:hypothetical protein
MSEIWKQISYAPNYEISTFGNIKNIKRNKLITINYERLKRDNKRARPGLSNNGKIKGYYLHRIVAEHFIENTNNLPEVNHIDGDFYNNKAENLEWISKLDNMRHAAENKLMKRYTRGIILKNKITNEVKIFNKVSDCAKFLNCNPGMVSLTCRGGRIDKLYDMKYQKDEKSIAENKDIIWKEFPECKKYLVSKTGEIKNKKTGRLMMGSKVNGYRFMTLFVGKDIPKLNRLVHRMVAQTFLQNPENKPVVNHKDTDILNNHIDNLEWVTYKENMNTDETINNLKKGKNSKIILQIDIESGNIINTFYGGSDGQNKTNIDSRIIINICHFYNKGITTTVQKKGTQKTYQKKYIFLFEKDKNNLEDYLKIARNNGPTKNQLSRRKKVIQIKKETNEIIQTFDSSCDASRKLNIATCIINGICNHHKYTDENRPKSLKYLHSHKGFIYKQIP